MDSVSNTNNEDLKSFVERLLSSNNVNEVMDKVSLTQEQGQMFFDFIGKFKDIIQGISQSLQEESNAILANKTLLLKECMESLRLAENFEEKQYYLEKMHSMQKETERNHIIKWIASIGIPSSFMLLILKGLSNHNRKSL